MEIGAVATTSSTASTAASRPTSTFSDPGTPVSQRVVYGLTAVPCDEAGDDEDRPDDGGWSPEEWTDYGWDGWAEDHGGHDAWQHDEVPSTWWVSPDEALYIIS